MKEKMEKILKKASFKISLIEIAITNAAALLTFYLIYTLNIEQVPQLEKYYVIPLIVLVIFLLKQNKKIMAETRTEVEEMFNEYSKEEL
ncbi:hypothetical protein [Clostridium ganghwense]|uniref:Uncharacterized protein n=1 Tax=Clostridium ganghwense TaxID=312089 RepID=A0ABT4CLN4_9CLOT|nr:hypothetical protein [Clostridium ganghwense]MCY6369960.1 hypothetical protein [Clostridium ganghwense]